MEFAELKCLSCSTTFRPTRGDQKYCSPRCRDRFLQRAWTRKHKDELHAKYANGVKLIMRNDGWLPMGSCPVKFEGDAGWVET